MQYNFIPEDVELYSFKCNQHVLVQKEFIHYVRGFGNVTKDEYVPPDLQYPYPLVNAYYEFAEDYDAVNRVPHLLYDQYPLESASDEPASSATTSTPTPPPSSTARPPKVDQLGERQAQVAYMGTPPKCFVILGKPGLGEERLGKLLADYWRCVLINPDTLIQDEIRSGSRAGLCIEFNLRCGRSISVDVIMRLLEKRLDSESVKHRGFVLCGFPLIANDLFAEDPVSSESAIFNVQEIFEEILESITLQDTVKHVSMTSITEEGVEVGEEKKTVEGEGPQHHIGKDKKLVQLKSVVSVQSAAPKEDYPICYQSRDFNKDTNQMEFVMSLCEEHDYLIIYLKCSNEEVVNIREDNRYEVQTMKQVSLQRERSDDLYYSLYNVYSDEVDHFLLDDVPLNQRIIKMQHDFTGHVRVQLDRYFLESQLVIEKYILLKNPQDIVRLDGRMSPHRLFQVLRMRLKVLPFAPAIIPKVLAFPSVEFDEPGEHPSPRTKTPPVYDTVASEDVYLALRNRKAPGPLYTWNLSDWKFSCPVAMKEGFQDLGYGRYAVNFMNNIFFLSNQERCEKFLENPRPYLLPPMPLTNRRVFVIGPPRSGKSAVAKCIQHFGGGGDIIDYRWLIARCDWQAASTLREKARKEAIQQSVNLMKEMRRKQYFEKEAARLAKVRAYIQCIRKSLLELQLALLILEDFSDLEFSTFPTISEREKPETVVQAEETVVKLADFCTLFKITTSEDCQEYLDDESMIMCLLPIDLQAPLLFTYDLVGTQSAWVINNTEEILQRMENEMSVKNDSIENIAKCVNTALINHNKLMKEGESPGWILDGFPPSGEVLKLIAPDNMPDMAYVIDDSTGGITLANINRGSDRYDHALLAELFHEEAHDASRFTEMESYSLYDLERDSIDAQISIDTYLAEELPDIKATLRELEIKHDLINMGGETLKKILTNLISNFKVTHNQTARAVTPEEKLLEPTYYGEYGDVLSGEFGGEDADEHGDTENVFRENRRLGNTADYDPVCYLYGALWKGKEDFLVTYLNKMWLFGNEVNMMEFLRTPQKYARHILLNEKIPPPRICIVGNKGVGKTTQAHLLCKFLGLFFLGFDNLGEDTDPHEQEESDDDILKNVILPFWHEPNKKAIGFVICGFPRRPRDIQFMLENNLIPDCIIELHMEPHELNARLVEILLAEWRVQINTEKEFERENHETDLEVWQTQRDEEKARLLEARRYQRYPRNEYGEAGEQSEIESLMSYKSYQEAEDEKEVEALLQDMYPAPILYENWETEEQATERIRLAVEDTTRADPNLLMNLKEIADHEKIPWHVVHANMEEIRVYNSMMQDIMKYLYRNQSFFERAYDVTTEMAERLLEHGYYFLSRFGKTCPVQLYENYNPLQMYTTKEAQFQLFPLIYGNYIYFLAGAESRELFKKDVLKYVLQEDRHLPLLRARVAVLGAPRSGKTTVAERMSAEYSLEHISVGKAVRRVLKYMPSSILAQRVRSFVDVGDEVPVNLVVQCAEAMTFEAKAVAQGYVMDGFPNTVEEFRLLAQQNLIPHLIIDLATSLDYIFRYMDVFDSVHKPGYSKAFIWSRYNDWIMDKEIVRDWIDSEYQNLTKITVEPSRWKTWCSVREILLAVINEIKHYYRYCHKDIALRVSNMLVTPYEFLKGQSEFKNYCPLCLYYENILTVSDDPPDRTGLLVYHGKFYWLCNEHINEFEDDPDKFLGPNIRHTLPVHLPRVVVLTELPQNIYLFGYCAVCMANSPDTTLLNMGDLSRATAYGEQIYMFDKPECMLQFNRNPHLSETLPQTLPTSIFHSCGMETLPTLGLLEQYVGSQIVKALIEVEHVRPLIPGLTIAQSAIVTLGLILKINNPNTPEKYLKHYKLSKRDSSDAQAALKHLIEDIKQTINPYLHYEEPVPPFQMDLTVLHKESTDSMYVRDLIDAMLDRIEYTETVQLGLGGG